ncbi:MAG: hypothetical protein EPN82_00245 [Bacteroidetes bacterium]|nr:MAG: hypothetical protein EPN82_00245 [Bacteroidota bacterium]
MGINTYVLHNPEHIPLQYFPLHLNFFSFFFFSFFLNFFFNFFLFFLFIIIIFRINIYNKT